MKFPNMHNEFDSSFSCERDLGTPGDFPFTRGIYADMYQKRLWTMRQYAGFGTAEATNKRFLYLLEQGQTGLSVAFDLPTQMGYDSDNAMSLGEVGKVGVAIDTLHDMETLLNNIPLDKVSTSMTINATAPILLAMYIAIADKKGVSRKSLSGTVQNDILKEYIARGTYIYPPTNSLRLVTDIMEFCAAQLPKWNPISISGYHMREAGATAIEEVGFTLANGITYIEAAKKRGISVDVIGKIVSFFFAAHSNILEEVAKFRAARRLWARLMKNRCGAKEKKAMMLRFHTQTGGVTLTAKQPTLNIIRVTLQALSAVLGGTQSLHTNSYDEALALPSEEAATIALRTQQILAHETGLSNFTDPLGGSYLIESLTSNIEKEAKNIIEKIDQLGGVLSAIEKGFIQEQIHKSAYEHQKRVESGKDIIVGVNNFTIDKVQSTPLMKIDKTTEQEQIKALYSHKKTRSIDTARQTLIKLEKAAKNDNENLMPHIIDAVKSMASLGEISDTLRNVFGTYSGLSLGS